MSLTNENDVMTMNTPSVYAAEEETWAKVEGMNYEYYDEYSDINESTVDTSKVIKLNPLQHNITQEMNSQYIPFRIPRYYDGFDLSTVKLQFYFVNRQGQYGINTAVNVYVNSDTIKMGWLVDSSATALDGKLKFEIQGIGVNSKGYKYVWKTQPNADMNIIKSLQGKSFIQPDDSWQESFLTKLDNKLAEADEAVREARNAVTEAESYAIQSEACIEECQEIVDNLAKTTIDSLKSQIEEDIQEIIDESFDKQITKTIDTKVNEALNSYYTEMTATLAEAQEYIGM